MIVESDPITKADSVKRSRSHKSKKLVGLERGKQWLFAKGDLLVGLVSVALAVYLGWQGIEGLRLA